MSILSVDYSWRRLGRKRKSFRPFAPGNAADAKNVVGTMYKCVTDQPDESGDTREHFHEVVLLQNNHSAGGDLSHEFRTGSQAPSPTTDSAADLIGSPVDGGIYSVGRFADPPRCSKATARDGTLRGGCRVHIIQHWRPYRP
jgi:hypothetical protein